MVRDALKCLSAQLARELEKGSHDYDFMNKIADQMYLMTSDLRHAPDSKDLMQRYVTPERNGQEPSDLPFDEPYYDDFEENMEEYYDD
jgi:hypothetical protein